MSKVTSELLTRAKRMAGKLGRTPKPLEFKERFESKGVTLTSGECRSLYMQVKSHREGKDVKSASNTSDKTKRKRNTKTATESTRRTHTKSTGRYGI